MGDPMPIGIDAICLLAGWSRRDLADRVGVGEAVLRYYAREGGPLWLGHALTGIAVGELGLSVDHARDLIGHPAAQHAVTTDSKAR
jgi:hypothetical protein